MHCSTATNTTTLANPKMHSLKPFTFTLNLLLLLLSLSSEKPLVHAEIEQVSLRDQSSLSLKTNNNSFASESDEEDILKRSCFIEADIIASNFTHLIKFGVKRYEGDKDPIYLNATLDTGSDHIWFHSQPCDNLLGCDCFCYNKGECIKKPNKTIGCEDSDCLNLKAFGIKNKCYPQNKELCFYDGKYADNTKLKGFFGTANFTFTNDKSGKAREKTLNVGFSTTKKDDDVPERNGIIGLGMGGFSLINQSIGVTKKRFSYYLPQFRRKDEQGMKDKSKFKFGCLVKISDKKSTSLLPKCDKYEICHTRYCVELKSICLKFKGKKCEDHKIEVSEGDTENDNVIVIDSGSTFTYLKNNIFEKLLGKLQKKLNDESPREILYYEKCFEKKDGDVEKLESISLEFGGTTVELKKENIFDELSVPDCNGGDPKNYVCLTVEGQSKGYHKRLRSYGKSVGEPQILGSRAQMDFTVTFDLEDDLDMKVSFENNEKISVLSE